MDSKRAGELILENIKNIYGYAFARLYDKADVDDLTSEIVCEILQSASGIRNEEAFWGFAWRVAENTFHKYLRRKNKLIPDVPEEMGLSPEEDYIERESDQEIQNKLRRELSLLSQINRTVCLAYYYQNKSCTQIAKEQNISPEMVKYHLFRTRRLLKEGIGMEREFGIKSYQPARFEFRTIFSGQGNREYSNLFKRKLPGNILHSAYYTPMTIREFAIELGVSSVYMEDEIALLEEYGLLTPLSGGKYQTNLLIFTPDYTMEFRRKAKEVLIPEIREILADVKTKINEIRNVGFRGCDLEETRILWPLLWLLIHRGSFSFEANMCGKFDMGLYDGATGVNYGVDYEPRRNGVEESEFLSEEYESESFAGFCGLNQKYAAAYADFGVLPKGCCFDREQMRKSLEQADNQDPGKQGTEKYDTDKIILFSQKELASLENLLKDEIMKMTILYVKLYGLATSIMREHAPQKTGSLIDVVVGKTLFFLTVGLIGKCAVDSGALEVPRDMKGIPNLAAFIYEISEKDLKNMNLRCGK